MRGPPAIVWVTDPALVKIVLVDHCDDFPQDPLLRRVLGGLFGNSILTSEGRDWRWQHQIVAPLFRHGEIVRYVPAMVAGAESAIKAWSAAPPGSTHAIDADMLRATYHVISNTLLPGGGALIGETMKRGTADYVEGISWSTAYAVLNLPVWLPRPAGGTGLRRKDEGVNRPWTSNEKISGRGSYLPPRGDETGLRLRTMGVWMISAQLTRQVEKNYRCRSVLHPRVIAELGGPHHQVT